MAFLTESEWNASEKYNGLITILRWGEVPEKKIFSVVSIEKKGNAKYETYMLHFVDAEEEDYQAYCPSHFLRQICKNQG